MSFGLHSRRSKVRMAAAGAIFAGGLALAGPAVAQTSTYVGVAPPQVGAVDATSGTRAASVVADQAQVRPQVANTSGLAFTGADIAGLTMLGGISIGVGVVAVRSGRRRAATPAS